jgi:opacity protein-like surface antigen
VRPKKRLAHLAIGLAMACLCSLPSEVRADGILAGFIGSNLRVETGLLDPEGDPAKSNTRVYGGVLGGVRSRGVGFEIDFGYSPDFFDTEGEFGIKTSITTVMGNLVIGGAAARGVAPFVSGGVGLIRTNVEAPQDLIENLTANEFGMNVGGGVNVMFASNVGVRGDIRYFRSFESETEDDNFPDFGIDLSSFDFWRGTVGLVLRW